MNMFKNKRILITGGTGSIGQTTIKELLKHKPKVVRILDLDETRQFELQEELKDYDNLRFLLGSIYDKERLYRAIEDIDIVFHMAALKHVFSCEYNPFEAVKINIIGTQNLIDVAIDKEIEKFIFTSSDKAVNPRNVMGATKLLGERLVTAANYYKGIRKTIFSSVRFGNVIGSRGSVIPLFKKQIKEGGPITLTNSEMTRFVMSMPQAVNLLFKATEIAQGGETFIFKMLVIRLANLAEVMIDELAEKYGYKASDIEIKTIGSKPGEKMHEELMTADEAARALEIKDMFIILPEMVELAPNINTSLYQAKPAKLKSYSSDSIKPLLKNEIKDLFIKEGLL